MRKIIAALMAIVVAMTMIPVSTTTAKTSKKAYTSFYEGVFNYKKVNARYTGKGFALVDLNGDQQEELVLAESSEQDNVVYKILSYTGMKLPVVNEIGASAEDTVYYNPANGYVIRKASSLVHEKYEVSNYK